MNWFEAKGRAALWKLHGVIRPPIERLIARTSSVGPGPFFDRENFAWARELESRTSVIRSELDRLLLHREQIARFHDVSPEQRKLTDDDLWRTFFLYVHGYRPAENSSLCPETTRALARVPGLDLAFFSILEPGKHIKPHRGVFNGVARCHLPLLVPASRERCWMRVGDETVGWEEGRTVFFDDTFEHEVHNETDGVRVVLFLNVRRPLPPPVAQLAALVIRLYAASSLMNNIRLRTARYEEEGTNEFP